MSKKTIIVSAFPACGKSYVYKNQGKIMTNFSCLDSDSSEFSWVKDSDGKNTTQRNPNFPDNYIAHIKENIGKVDVIFVSSHKQVVDALESNELRWVKVLPSNKCKAEWIGRFWLRGDDNSFISFISDNWDDFTNPYATDDYDYLVGKVILYTNNFITDSLDFILSCTGNYEGE